MIRCWDIITRKKYDHYYVDSVDFIPRSRRSRCCRCRRCRRSIEGKRLERAEIQREKTEIREKQKRAT